MSKIRTFATGKLLTSLFKAELTDSQYFALQPGTAPARMDGMGFLSPSLEAEKEYFGFLLPLRIMIHFRMISKRNFLQINESVWL